MRANIVAKLKVKEEGLCGEEDAKKQFRSREGISFMEKKRKAAPGKGRGTCDKGSKRVDAALSPCCLIEKRTYSRCMVR